MKKIFLLIILAAITTIIAFSQDTIWYKKSSCSTASGCGESLNFNYKSDTLIIFGMFGANCFVTNRAVVEKIRDTIFISTIDSIESECGCGICIEIKIPAVKEDTIVKLDGVVYNTKTGLNSINESVNSGNLIKIFPNPANEILNIEVPDQFKLSSIIITDLTGRIVYNRGRSIRTINLEEILSGLYFLIIDLENNERVVKKIIKE